MALEHVGVLVQNTNLDTGLTYVKVLTQEGPWT